jgi:hypothetical protein
VHGCRCRVTVDATPPCFKNLSFRQPARHGGELAEFARMESDQLLENGQPNPDYAPVTPSRGVRSWRPAGSSRVS